MDIGFILTLIGMALLVGFIAVVSVAVYRDYQAANRRLANRAALSIQSDREFDRFMALLSASDRKLAVQSATSHCGW